MSRVLIDYLKRVLPPENVLQEEPMAGHTSFRVGGPAEVYVTVETAEQLGKVIRYLNLAQWPYFILGNGTNLLVGDRGYRGVIVHLGKGFSEIRVQGEHILTGAAALLPQVARKAMEAQLTGLEFASGIPGSVGGAVRMNAGAYGGELGRLTERVVVLNRDGEQMELDNDTMEFGYRRSVLRDRPFVVMEVVLKLEAGERQLISDRMDELMERRRQKQPLEYASAGSTFKRPEGHYAGKLIMEAGLSGCRIGGARVSEKHCGFIINDGTATARDIKSLIDKVIGTVRDSSGVRLEPEVIFLGDF